VFILTVGQTLRPATSTTPAPRFPGTLRVVEDHDGTLAGLERRPATLESKITIKVHGNSSGYFYEQKPLRIELVDDQGADRRVPLLGLPPEADFVLSSCFSDKSCLRNALMYAVGREMAAPARRWWTPRTRYVEVMLDGRYQGLYLLVEKIESSKSRLALAEPAADPAMGDISGGYVFSGEGTQGKGFGRDWVDPVRAGYKWTYRFPDEKRITAAQKTYLQASVTDLGRTFVSDPNYRASYPKKLDVPSWVDLYLAYELANNIDGFWKSFYIHKLPDAQGGKFVAGPLWDFDLAFGNVNYTRRYCTNLGQREGQPLPWSRLLDDPAFIDQAKCRWLELRKPGGPFDLRRMEEKVDAFVRHIEAGKKRDQERWKTIGRWVWPNNYVGASYDDEVRYLKYWLRKRVAWIDANLRGACAAMPPPPRVDFLPLPPTVTEATARPVLIPGLRQAPVYVPVDMPTSDPRLAGFSCP
jgi:hypothetical protein